jgi:hypothetical protein
MVHRSAQSARERAALSRLRQILNDAGAVLRANCVLRKHRCGKAACRCKSSRRYRHQSWYVSQSHNGKLRAKYISSERIDEIRDWVARYQEARQLLMVVGDAAWERLDA